MNLGPHATFIVAAYGVGTFLIAALIAWVVFDHRKQARMLDELEARGVMRRSERGSGGQP